MIFPRHLRISSRLPLRSLILTAFLLSLTACAWAAPPPALVLQDPGLPNADPALGKALSATGLDFQGKYIDTAYRLARKAGADGLFFWWYCGGFRTGENSDYGVVNADGTDRPATEAIRRQGRAFLNDPPRALPDLLLPYDRDAHPDGIHGIFEALKARFAEAEKQGHRPGLKPIKQP